MASTGCVKVPRSRSRQLRRRVLRVLRQHTAGRTHGVRPVQAVQRQDTAIIVRMQRKTPPRLSRQRQHPPHLSEAALPRNDIAFTARK